MMDCEETQSCEVWEIEIIDETSHGLLVMAPNGDTQWMTKDEYDQFIVNREKLSNQN